MRRPPWFALAALVAAAGIRVLGLLAPWLPALPDCPFKTVTGLPCATCGLTRCVLALGEGKWREAFYWHPAAVVALGFMPLVGLWDLRRAWAGRPYPPLPDSLALRLLAGGLLLGAWALQVARGI